MGMERRVRCPSGAAVLWEDVAELLRQHNYPVQMRMIDGELAFPDETPPEDWRELRVGTPGGMITLQREGQAVAVVTWGNADAAMQQAWNLLTWACAAAAGGVIQTETRDWSADEFRQEVTFPSSSTDHSGTAGQ